MTTTTTTPTKRLKTFTVDQRVRVIESHDGVALNALGTVARVRISDGGAFVKLDVPHQKYPDTGRGSRVMVYPENCEIPVEGGKAKGNRAARRKSEQSNEALAQEPTEVTVAMFGADHWSTFGYITTIVLDGGNPDRRRMRCDESRHPLLAHTTGGPYPTRLKGGVELLNHDDWDCINDLERAGLVENRGSAMNPALRLTPLGAKVALQLQDHKQNGGNFATFTPKLED